MINAKNIPFALLMSSLATAKADKIDGITVEQVSQIHNAVTLSGTITGLIETITDCAQDNTDFDRDTMISKLGDIHVSLTALATSVNIPMKVVSASATAKIVLANKPKAEPKAKEEQIDIEDVTSKGNKEDTSSTKK